MAQGSVLEPFPLIALITGSYQINVFNQTIYPGFKGNIYNYLLSILTCILTCILNSKYLEVNSWSSPI